MPICKYSTPFFRRNSAIQLVSEKLVSRFFNLVAMTPCFRQNNFPPRFECRSLGNSKFSKINCEFEKLSSNLVSSIQNPSKGVFAIISLRLIILFCGVLIFTYPMMKLLRYEFLTLIKPSISNLIVAS